MMRGLGLKLTVNIRKHCLPCTVPRQSLSSSRSIKFVGNEEREGRLEVRGCSNCG
jgi:hypothetical protein